MSRPRSFISLLQIPTETHWNKVVFVHCTLCFFGFDTLIQSIAWTLQLWGKFLFLISRKRSETKYAQNQHNSFQIKEKQNKTTISILKYSEKKKRKQTKTQPHKTTLHIIASRFVSQQIRIPRHHPHPFVSCMKSTATSLLKQVTFLFFPKRIQLSIEPMSPQKWTFVQFLYHIHATTKATNLVSPHKRQKKTT